MVRAITLQNFRSFGLKQTVPLEAISVLVGPNNSGKSCFLSVGALFRAFCFADEGGPTASKALECVGGKDYFFHRPPTNDGTMVIEWETAAGSYAVQLRATRTWGAAMLQEDLVPVDGTPQHFKQDGDRASSPAQMFLGLREAHKTSDDKAPIVRPLIESREIRLFLPSIRRDADFETSPLLGADGSNAASVLSHWRSAYPERAEELEEILSKSIPEFRHVLAMPAPEGPKYRLWIQQTDGVRLPAEFISDGVLLFTALAMHAVEAEPESLIFIEEPEHFLHPLRLHEIVELFRRIHDRKKCQFVIATHSPIFLNEFRDEPESILLFRRSEEGSRVTQLSEVPKLVDALRTNMPGDLLAGGFFNDPLP